MLTVGVLALQGAVAEHLDMLEKCGARARPVKKPGELDGLDALIIPGGESTTIGKLMRAFGLDEAVASRARAGSRFPIWGTCAGMVLLAGRLPGHQQPVLGLMDIAVRRNAFGRQRESFEADLEIPAVGSEPFRGVFIRAPYIEESGKGVEVLAAYDGHPVLARQGPYLASSFHPELAEDPRLHCYFLNLIAAGGGGG